jgi:hypothetical protein
VVPSGDVDTHWCRRARCRCMARGSRVSLDCCYEHAGLCPGRGPSGPAPCRRWSHYGEGGEGRDGGYVRPGRRSGCRQGDGDGVPAHARPTRWPRPSIDSQRPSRVCTLFATATRVCRRLQFGSNRLRNGLGKYRSNIQAEVSVQGSASPTPRRRARRSAW